ncbi:MAG: KH domain-containing protein [Verrucomicrobiota bacterium]
MEAKEQLQSFLEFAVGGIASDPEALEIVCTEESEKSFKYQVRVGDEDVPKVVGKSGFTASAIRSLLKVGAEKLGVEANLRVDGAKR